MFGGQQWGFRVEVRFRTKKLKKQYEQSGEATKAYGQEVGRRYIGRINIIKQALDINELCSLPVLHCHSLKEDRLGQWSITLVNFYRLIFTLEGSKLEIVEIKEVSKHYDD